jgi:hypothetical protein
MSAAECREKSKQRTVIAKKEKCLMIRVVLSVLGAFVHLATGECMDSIQT